MKKFLERLHGYFIPMQYRQNEEVYRKSKLLINTTLLTALFAVFFMGNTLLFGMPTLFKIMLVCAVFFTLFAWFFRWGVPKNTIVHFYVGLACICSALDTFYTGGLNSFNIVWFSLSPVCALLLSSIRNGWIWLIITATVVFILGVIQLNGFEFPHELDPKYKNYMYLNSYLGFIFIIFFITNMMENATIRSIFKLEDNNKIIENEKKRSDDLLHNILPAEIITELKHTGASKARNFDNTTVLFTDYVNFTKLSVLMSPEELVKEIDYCFRAFDKIIEKYGLEKIKTIGDAYLAVSGLPLENDQHAQNTVAAAIEMLEFTKQNLRNGGKFEIKIGIHSGPLVAGVVGVKKFAYDIWGDTVNTASRMVNACYPGKINISETTYELVKNIYHAENRGEIEAKNKGKLQMYFVNEHQAVEV
jgi:adenylate cyclase